MDTSAKERETRRAFHVGFEPVETRPGYWFESVEGMAPHELAVVRIADSQHDRFV